MKYLFRALVTIPCALMALIGPPALFNMHNDGALIAAVILLIASIAIPFAYIVNIEPKLWSDL